MIESLSRGLVQPETASVGLRGLTLASKFLLVVVLARFLPPEDLGAYGLMASATAIAVFALGLEYHYFTIRSLISRQPAGQVAVMRDQAVLYALVSAGALPLLAILVWTGTWLPLPASVIGWFFALVVVELAAQELGIALIALSRPLAANLVLFVRSGLWTYAVIALTLIGRGTIDSVFLMWFLGALLSIGVAAWSLRGMGWRAALAEPVDWLAMRAGLRVAAPFVVTTGASMGLLFVDRFIIAAVWGLGAVGVYTFLAGITTALNTLVNTGVSMIRMPKLVRANQDSDVQRFSDELGMMLRITTISAVLLAIGIAAGIVPLLRVVGKMVYQDNLGTFFLLLAGAVIRSIADVPIYALYAKHRDLTLLGVTLGAFVVAVTLNLVLVPAVGIQGAAMAAIAGASTLLLTASALVIRGRERMNPPQSEESPPARLAL